MPETGADSTGVGENPATEAPQVSTVVQVATSAPSVPVNTITGKFQGIIGFTITQVQVLVDGGYDRQESVLYWEFIDIKEWCHLKSNIPASCGGVSYWDRKINWFQVLSWWVTDLTLRDEIIDLNNFKTDIISGTIEESRIDFEDTIYVKEGLSKSKELSNENWTQW